MIFLIAKINLNLELNISKLVFHELTSIFFSLVFCHVDLALCFLTKYLLLIFILDFLSVNKF